MWPSGRADLLGAPRRVLGLAVQQRGGRSNACPAGSALVGILFRNVQIVLHIGQNVGISAQGDGDTGMG